MEIAKNVDFVISFWSSGAMDCNTLGVPVIEYFDPNKYSKQQIYEGEGFTTIYRKLGIVFPANNEIELGRVVSSLVESNATKAKITPHSFYNDLMNKSSNDMIELASIIENSDDVKVSLNKLMWGNCKACHSKFRAPH